MPEPGKWRRFAAGRSSSFGDGSAWLASTVLVSPTAKTVSLSMCRRADNAGDRNDRSGWVCRRPGRLAEFMTRSTMTLQERIDYLTNMSETIVGQLQELIALNE